MACAAVARFSPRSSCAVVFAAGAGSGRRCPSRAHRALPTGEADLAGRCRGFDRRSTPPSARIQVPALWWCLSRHRGLDRFLGAGPDPMGQALRQLLAPRGRGPVELCRFSPSLRAFGQSQRHPGVVTPDPLSSDSGRSQHHKMAPLCLAIRGGDGGWPDNRGPIPAPSCGGLGAVKCSVSTRRTPIREDLSVMYG
jgi:hypothetical protein